MWLAFWDGHLTFTIWKQPRTTSMKTGPEHTNSHWSESLSMAFPPCLTPKIHGHRRLGMTPTSTNRCLQREKLHHRGIVFRFLIISVYLTSEQLPCQRGTLIGKGFSLIVMLLVSDRGVFFSIWPTCHMGGNKAMFKSSFKGRWPNVQTLKPMRRMQRITWTLILTKRLKTHVDEKRKIQSNYAISKHSDVLFVDSTMVYNYHLSIYHHLSM